MTLLSLTSSLMESRPMRSSVTMAMMANHLVEKMDERDIEVAIPSKRDRKCPRVYDTVLYKERNHIERFFDKLKQFLRVATRYDKLLANFIGFVKLAAIVIWLK